MSHLSILPTILRDWDTLHATLTDLGLQPRRAATVTGFNGSSESVRLAVDLPGGTTIGWKAGERGQIELVGDLQQVAVRQDLQRLLSAITRRCALRGALRTALAEFPTASVTVHPEA